jgi:hypothetical protein
MRLFFSFFFWGILWQFFFSFLCKMVKFHHKKYWILGSIVDSYVYIFCFFDKWIVYTPLVPSSWSELLTLSPMQCVIKLFEKKFNTYIVGQYFFFMIKFPPLVVDAILLFVWKVFIVLGTLVWLALDINFQKKIEHVTF